MTEQPGESSPGKHAGPPQRQPRARRGKDPDHPGGPHRRGQHGSNLSSWSVVAIVLAGFLVWGIGMVLGPDWRLVWIGAALVPVGLIVGATLSRVGLGAPRH